MAISRKDIIAAREACVAEAFTWLNTPYVECGAIKGIKGAADCAMLLVRVFQVHPAGDAAPMRGGVPADYDPRPYSPDWHLHQDAELYMAGLEKYSVQVPRARRGDIAMYKFGRHASHGAVIVGENLLIHAHKKNGCVELCERRAMEHWFHSFWSPKVWQ